MAGSRGRISSGARIFFPGSDVWRKIAPGLDPGFPARVSAWAMNSSAKVTASDFKSAWTCTLLPGGGTDLSATIDYTYDPPSRSTPVGGYRLTSADYSTDISYHYTYDPVGNRLEQESTVNGLPSTVSYTYDDANRMTTAGGTAYTWDANGNLLSDGTNTYAYDAANRLSSVVGPSSSVSYAYNGQGDRLRQTADGVATSYTLDLNAGLTQVLDDGTNTYLYGNGRIAQLGAATDAGYFLGDALGSVRQLTDNTGTVTYAASYDPYGEVLSATGDAQTSYGFTGEAQENGMVYLRARYYAPGQGRFVTRDTWGGDENQPMSYNAWLYGFDNPPKYTDPSGHSPEFDPNCAGWPTYSLGYGNLQELCRQADWDDNRRNWDLVNQVPIEQLDAREAIYRSIISGASMGYIATGNIGYAYLAAMFTNFLDGNGSSIAWRFTQDNPFVNDPGITRATRGLSPSTHQYAGNDEPDLVLPLLYLFLEQDVEQYAISTGEFQVPSASKMGGDNITYFSAPRDLGREPRPTGVPFWAAFGHVTINGNFVARGKYSCTYGGYLIDYRAAYHIRDNYEWFNYKKTPLPLPGITQDVSIPHLWALSLEASNHPRAHRYTYTIDWPENGVIFTTDFEQFQAAFPWQYYLP